MKPRDLSRRPQTSKGDAPITGIAFIDDGPTPLHPAVWTLLTALAVCSTTTEAPPASPPPDAWRGHKVEHLPDDVLILDDPPTLPARRSPAVPPLPAVPAPTWARALRNEERHLPRRTRRALARMRRASV